jgi:glycosyltransferase involved in cell wall biosynthesis
MGFAPKVSVCTPVYNGGKFLDKCIQGVLNQKFGKFEYIIVDNASTDETAEIIEYYRKSDSRIKVFRNDTTIPVIDNFRKCIEYISPDAKWIKYALADDILFPHCIQDMLDLGEQDPQIGLVSAYRLYGTSLHYLGLPMDQNIFDGASILKQQILHEYHVCSGSPNSLMYRREIFDKLGGFDRDYLHADTKLAYRLLDKYKIGFVHDVLTWTGDHGGRVEASSIKAGRNIKEYLDFGYREIDSYASIQLSEQEMTRLRDYYAGCLLEFRINRLSDFNFRLPESMSECIPPEIAARYGTVLRRNWRRYTRLVLSVLKRAMVGKH